MNKYHIEYLRDSDGDWCVLKVNGEKIAENHSINVEDLLTWLQENDILSVTYYDIEDSEITEDGEELFYDDMSDWVKKYYDEYVEPYIEKDGL